VVMVARSSAFGGLRKITDIVPHPGHGEDSAHDPDHLGHRPGHLVHRPERPRTHRREDLNGLRPGPSAAASPLDQPAPLDAGPVDLGRPRRVHRRPFHGPASGEGGG
jgi:hypothetical protein